MIAEHWRPRADDDTLARAKSTLEKSKIPAIRKLDVELVSTGVVLRGHVPLYYYKQLAQELVRAELEDISILNRIEVGDTQ